MRVLASFALDCPASAAHQCTAASALCPLPAAVARGRDCCLRVVRLYKMQDMILAAWAQLLTQGASRHSLPCGMVETRAAELDQRMTRDRMAPGIVHMYEVTARCKARLTARFGSWAAMQRVVEEHACILQQRQQEADPPKVRHPCEVLGANWCS